MIYGWGTLQPMPQLFGLPITIEYRKGDTRTGVGPDGKKWERKLFAAYGEIKRTEGLDGDALDVYVGPDLDATKVYAITQLKGPEFKKVDEQKFMLGFKTADEAKRIYLSHYPDPKILGGMKEMTLEDFQAKAATSDGKKISMAAFVELNLERLRRGEELVPLEKVSAQVMGGAGAAQMAAQFSAERGVASPYVADLGGMDPSQYPRGGFGGRSMRSRNGSGMHYKIAEILEKRAEHKRVEALADRVDDVGIGILAAPYAAKGLANTLAHKGGRLGAIGKAARVVADHMHHHENKYELAGLAAVAPSITNHTARVVDKTIDKVSADQKAGLEKIAMGLYPDYEYLTEPQKVAFLKTMTGMARSAGKAIGESASRTKGMVKQMVKPDPSITAAVRTRTAERATTQKGMQQVAAKAPPAVAPVTAKAPRPQAPTPQPASKPMITGGTVARAAGLGAVGLGVYGGAKAIGAAANLASGQHHNRAAASPDFTPGT